MLNLCECERHSSMHAEDGTGKSLRTAERKFNKMERRMNRGTGWNKECAIRGVELKMAGCFIEDSGNVLLRNDGMHRDVLYWR